MFSFNRSFGALAAAAFIVAAGACQTLKTEKEKGAVIGATTGAVVGGIVGKATGSTARGAIVGAAVGGTAGAIIGHQMDQKAKEITASVPGATVTRVGEGLDVTFDSGLLFDFNSDKLRPEPASNHPNKQQRSRYAKPGPSMITHAKTVLPEEQVLWHRDSSLLPHVNIRTK